MASMWNRSGRSSALPTPCDHEALRVCRQGFAMSGAVTFPADPSDHCLVWPEDGPSMAVGWGQVPRLAGRSARYGWGLGRVPRLVGRRPRYGGVRQTPADTVRRILTDV